MVGVLVQGRVDWRSRGTARTQGPGEAARAAYAATGAVEYVPGVDGERADVGMPGEHVWSWYQRWADAGVQPNRYVVMSDAELLAHESLSESPRGRSGCRGPARRSTSTSTTTRP